MKIKAKYVNPDVVVGTTRLCRKFALLPHKVDDTWVWLECYEVLQAWLATPVILLIKAKPTTFTLAKWTDVSERLIS